MPAHTPLSPKGEVSPIDNKKEFNMYYGAPAYIFLRAKILRGNQTLSEKILWEYLKNNKFGVKFRRQHPINLFIADFYSHSKKIVIEIDGKNHHLKIQKEYDNDREEIFKSFGIKVIRFTNEEVLNNMDSVIFRISEFL